MKNPQPASDVRRLGQAWRRRSEEVVAGLCRIDEDVAWAVARPRAHRSI